MNERRRLVYVYKLSGNVQKYGWDLNFIYLTFILRGKMLQTWSGHDMNAEYVSVLIQSLFIGYGNGQNLRFFFSLYSFLSYFCMFSESGGYGPNVAVPLETVGAVWCRSSKISETRRRRTRGWGEWIVNFTSTDRQLQQNRCAEIGRRLNVCRTTVKEGRSENGELFEPSSRRTSGTVKLTGGSAPYR